MHMDTLLWITLRAKEVLKIIEKKILAKENNGII